MGTNLFGGNCAIWYPTLIYSDCSSPYVLQLEYMIFLRIFFTTSVYFTRCRRACMLKTTTIHLVLSNSTTEGCASKTRCQKVQPHVSSSPLVSGLQQMTGRETWFGFMWFVLLHHEHALFSTNEVEQQSDGQFNCQTVANIGRHWDRFAPLACVEVRVI